MSDQLEFPFTDPSGEDAAQPVLPGLFPDGLDEWRARRREEMETLAHSLGLPLGHEVELVLGSGPLLRGKLLLADQRLWVDATGRDNGLLLRIGAAEFHAREVESCVRLD